MRNILFLDIDGVLNHKESFRKKESKTIKLANSNERYEQFSLSSKKLLNRLIEEFDLYIVISSTWRRCFSFEELKLIWQQEGMVGEIKSITPHLTTRYFNSTLNVPRGFEIEQWLSDKGFYHCNWSIEEQKRICKSSKIRQYCIIDDDSDMTYNQRNNFVHVLEDPTNISGFNECYYEKARMIFKRDITNTE